MQSDCCTVGLDLRASIAVMRFASSGSSCATVEFAACVEVLVLIRETGTGGRKRYGGQAAGQQRRFCTMGGPKGTSHLLYYNIGFTSCQPGNSSAEGDGPLIKKLIGSTHINS